MNDFCVFILSHGRPNKVKTYNTLLSCGYTGRIYIIIDNEDKTSSDYYNLFSDKVIMFDKLQISKKFDMMDNFGKRNSIVCARNSCWEIAENLGVNYFIQLDDDYTDFRYKLDNDFNNINGDKINNLDNIFNILLEYYKSIPALSIAISQGGDFIGGKEGNAANSPIFRKCMNSFICSTKRKFNFIGTLNEDVNAYAFLGSMGNIFLNIPNVALQQLATQKNSGGMTDIYINTGTYIKSFYTIMCCPSSTKIQLMMSNHPRLHHAVNWNCAVPKIIRENFKK